MSLSIKPFSETFEPVDSSPYGYGYSSSSSSTTFARSAFVSGVSDRVFDKSKQYASPPPKPRLPAVDEVEKVTFAVICQMLTLADGIERTEIKDAFQVLDQVVDHVKAKNLNYAFKGKKVFQKSVSPSKFSYSHEFRPYDSDTHFNDEVIDTPIQIGRVVHNIFSMLAKLFLGRDTLNSIRTIVDNSIRRIVEGPLSLLAKLFLGQKSSQEDRRTLSKQRKDHDLHWTLWKDIADKYNRDFQGIVNCIFNTAENLLNKREADEKKAHNYRVTFYATLALSIVGKALSQRFISIIGLGASVITLLFMIKHYGNSSFAQDRLAQSLKEETGGIYLMAARARLPAQKQPVT